MIGIVIVGINLMINQIHQSTQNSKTIYDLSVNNGSEYKGGELEFDFRNYDP